MTVLVPVLGDQLSHGLASLTGCDPADTVVLMMEVAEEATHVRHHKAKIALIFSAMRHFAAELQAAGWRVDYVRLDDPDNAGSFTGEIIRASERHSPRLIRVVEPGDWRVEQAMLDWQTFTGCPVEILPDSRFLCSRDEFAGWAAGRKELRMEFFYREMRRRTGLLMDGKDPVGGKWNFDAENRSGPPPGLAGPPLPRLAPNAMTQQVVELVSTRFADHFGSLEHFNWPVTAAEAEQAAEAFLNKRLPTFGQLQDAMVRGQD
ncbi:MAG: cryptochrome/photolyase family protein, partial [Novosphingobium sp.]